MNTIKMFIAGIAFPSTFLPLLLFIALMAGKYQMLYVPFLHFIPVIWGIWNILYFLIFIRILPKNETIRLLLTGGILGLLVASYGVCCLHIPMLLGIPKSLYLLPLFVGPILYAVLWLYVVKPLNHLLGVQEPTK